MTGTLRDLQHFRPQSGQKEGEFGEGKEGEVEGEALPERPVICGIREGPDRPLAEHGARDDVSLHVPEDGVKEEMGDLQTSTRNRFKFEVLPKKFLILISTKQHFFRLRHNVHAANYLHDLKKKKVQPPDGAVSRFLIHVVLFVTVHDEKVLNKLFSFAD